MQGRKLAMSEYPVKAVIKPVTKRERERERERE